jgi:hypothetical protein
MRFVRLLLCCALVLFGAAGCSDSKRARVSDDESVLLITTYVWNGFALNDETEYEYYKYGLILGAEYSCPPDSESFLSLQFEIVEIKDGSVTIKTTRPMSEEHEGNRISLETDQTEFTIVEGEVLTLVTPTMDAGGVFAIELHLPLDNPSSTALSSFLPPPIVTCSY